MDDPDKVKQATASPEQVKQEAFGPDKFEQAAASHRQGRLNRRRLARLGRAREQAGCCLLDGCQAGIRAPIIWAYGSFHSDKPNKPGLPVSPK